MHPSIRVTDTYTCAGLIVIITIIMCRITCPLGGWTCPLGGWTCPLGGLLCPLGGLLCPLGRLTCLLLTLSLVLLGVSESSNYHVIWLLSIICLVRWLYLNERIATNSYLIGKLPKVIASHDSVRSPIVLVLVVLRPVSLLTLSLMTLLDSNLPGNPPWAWEFVIVAIMYVYY